MMKYRRLGASGLKVSEIGLGSWFYGTGAEPGMRLNVSISRTTWESTFLIPRICIKTEQPKWYWGRP